MFQTTLFVNSNLVSGLVKVAWQLLPSVAIYRLVGIMCSSFNLYQVYERRSTLTPKNSLLSTITSAPIGHPPLIYLLSILLLIHILLSLLLDFSINGETIPIYQPTVYRSVVADHPRSKPLHIDFQLEFASVDAPGKFRFPEGVPREKRLVSRRLLAAAEAQGCIELNEKQRTAYAHAYNVTLDNTLVSLESRPPIAQCVRRGIFDTDRVSHQYKLTGFPHAACIIKNISVSYARGTMIGVGLPTFENCDLSFSDIRCFHFDSEHCAAVAHHKASPKTQYMFYISDIRDTGNYRLHQMRNMDGMLREEHAQFAANVAFTQAIGLRNGDFNAMFIAVAHIEQDVILQRFIRKREVTVLNLAIIVPVISVEIVMLILLSVLGSTMWIRWVVWKGRRHYIKFTSLLDIFAMVRQNGLSKEYETGRLKRIVSLYGKEPRIFVDQEHAAAWKAAFQFNGDEDME